MAFLKPKIADFNDDDDVDDDRLFADALLHDEYHHGHLRGQEEEGARGRHPQPPAQRTRLRHQPREHPTDEVRRARQSMNCWTTTSTSGTALFMSMLTYIQRLLMHYFPSSFDAHLSVSLW